MSNPRERLLDAIDGKSAGHPPLSFLLFSALQARCTTEGEFVQRQLEMGLDPFVSLPGVSTPFHPDVETEVQVENATPYPLIHKVYHTPAGDLECIVEKAWDWPHGDDIPLFSDFTIPRGRKFLVTEESELEALKFLFTAPSDQAISTFRDEARVLKGFADEHGLPTRAGFDRLGDTVCWLCGQIQFATMGLTQPELLAGVLDIIADWQRMKADVILEAEPDVYVQAEWYATPFLSPSLFERFLTPILSAKFRSIHEAGARVCYIGTADVMPFLDLLKRLGIDVLFGPDPISGHWDMPKAAQQCRTDLCLWGGVNGYLDVVDATEEKLEQAVRTAMATFGSNDRFILGPIDDVRIEPSESDPDAVWQRICRNIKHMVRVWRELS